MHIFACIKYLDVNVVVEKTVILCLCFSLLLDSLILEGFLQKYSNALHCVNSGKLEF